jgi:hypothetical protein
VFQLILPFQLELPFEPAPAGDAQQVQGAEQARPARGTAPRVRRSRVRARASALAGTHDLTLGAREA